MHRNRMTVIHNVSTNLDEIEVIVGFSKWKVREACEKYWSQQVEHMQGTGEVYVEVSVTYWHVKPVANYRFLNVQWCHGWQLSNESIRRANTAEMSLHFHQKCSRRSWFKKRLLLRSIHHFESDSGFHFLHWHIYRLVDCVWLFWIYNIIYLF